MKKIIKIFTLPFVLIVFLFGLTACSSIYKNDKVALRQAAIDKDLSIIKRNMSEWFKQPLTLEEVIHIGLANNLEMRVRKITEDVSNEELIASKLKMLPKLNALGDYKKKNNYEIKGYKDLATNEELLHGTTVSEEKETNIGNITFSWNLLDFGLSYIRSKQKAAKTEINRIETMRQAQLLTMNIISAYWKTITAESNLEKIPNMETMLKAYKKTVEDLVAQKRMDPIKVKEIERDMVNLALTASSLQSEVSGAKIDLARLMGISPDTKINLAKADIESYIDKMPLPEAFKPQEMEMISLKHRPELFASDMEIKVRQEEARAVIATMFPAIRFDMMRDYSSNKFLEYSYWNTVGANIALDILSLPFKIKSYNAEKMNISLAETQRTLLSASVLAQVYMSANNFGASKKQFELYNRSYSIQQDMFNIAFARHRANMLTDAEMVRYSMEVMVAKLKRDKAFVSFTDSYSMLMTSLGLNYTDWDSTLKSANADQKPVKKVEAVKEETLKPAENKESESKEIVKQSKIEPDKKAQKETEPKVEKNGLPNPLINPKILVGKLYNLYGITVEIREYTITKGIYLAQILNDYCKIPKEKVYNEFINIVDRLNPSLKKNQIEVGDVIFIPVRVN